MTLFEGLLLLAAGILLGRVVVEGLTLYVSTRSLSATARGLVVFLWPFPRKRR